MSSWPATATGQLSTWPRKHQTSLSFCWSTLWDFYVLCVDTYITVWCRFPAILMKTPRQETYRQNWWAGHERLLFMTEKQISCKRPFHNDINVRSQGAWHIRHGNWRSVHACDQSRRCVVKIITVTNLCQDHKSCRYKWIPMDPTVWHVNVENFRDLTMICTIAALQRQTKEQVSRVIRSVDLNTIEWFKVMIIHTIRSSIIFRR